MQTPAWKLSQFNIRANYLAESRFLQWIKTRGNKQPDMAAMLSGNWLVYEGLNREDLDSFFLNLRLILQDRDGFSIRCLSQLYEDFPPDFFEAQELFKYVRDQLNSHLEKPSMVRVTAQPNSKRYILETILYGGFAHTDPKHYNEFLRLTTSGVFSMFTFVEFMNIIIVLNDYIQKIAVLNAEVLPWLEESNNSVRSFPSTPGA